MYINYLGILINESGTENTGVLEHSVTLKIAAVVCIILCIIAVVSVIRSKLYVARVMKSMDSMLDKVIKGEMLEKQFDETMESKVETKLRNYLTSTQVSGENATKEKDSIKQLIGDISHQTKTPIANLLLYTDMLQECALDEEAAVCTEAIKSQSEKLNFLVASLVKLSRLENGIFRLNPVETQVNKILEEIKRQFRQKAEEKNLTFTIETTKAIAVFDEKWTVEAIGNVVDNAIKYTEAGGSVSIRVVDMEMFVCVEIADTGIGISEGEQANVFARFYRSQTVATQEGVGVGLYLTREILSKQDGYIKVRSQEGKGAVFCVYLSKTL